jgi:hypothetical protein
MVNPNATAEDVQDVREACQLDSEMHIARLEGRIAALEAALARRSDEIRLLQRYISRRGLAQLARLAAGLHPMPLIACEPGYWQETRDLTAAEVPETMLNMWASIYPRTPPQ